MPRYTRDEILEQALELASSPTVTQHDMPGGLIDPNAYSIKWLQNALDMFHNKYPFSTDVTSISVTFLANQNDVVLTNDNSLNLPNDFILDVKDGLLITISNQTHRLRRKSFQYWLSENIQNVNTAQDTISYCKINSRLKITPKLSSNQTGTLWYYAMPALLHHNDYPGNIFPDEHTLIEFVRIKALEYTRTVEIGTATAFMQKELARLRADGLIDDSEYDVPPLENNQVILNSMFVNRNAWMGR